MEIKIKDYLYLIFINLYISAFTFGGGYIVVPMVKKYLVEEKNYFSEEELIEMAAISQSSPGATAINLIALSGYRVAGIKGVILSCISAIIPPIAILSVISLFYSVFITNQVVASALKGMQAAVAALIVDFIVDMGSIILKEKSHLLSSIVVISFLISFFTSINVIFVLLGSALLCVIVTMIKLRRKK